MKKKNEALEGCHGRQSQSQSHPPGSATAATAEAVTAAFRGNPFPDNRDRSHFSKRQNSNDNPDHLQNQCAVA
jgi:hypothetical protein